MTSKYDEAQSLWYEMLKQASQLADKKQINSALETKKQAYVIRGQFLAIKCYLFENRQKNPFVYRDFTKVAKVYQSFHGDSEKYEQETRNKPLYPSAKVAKCWAHFFLEKEYPDIQDLRDGKKVRELLRELMKHAKGGLVDNRTPAWRKVEEYQLKNPDAFWCEYNNYLKKCAEFEFLEEKTKNKSEKEALKRKHSAYVDQSVWGKMEFDRYIGLPLSSSQSDWEIASNKSFKRTLLNIYKLEHEIFSSSIPDPQKTLAQSPLALSIKQK